MADQKNRQMITRRDFLKLLTNASILSVGAITTLLVVENEKESPVVERVQIPIPGLPSSLEGFRIVQISDIHYYPFTTIELVDLMVRMSNQLKPDLVVLTGDFIWHEVEAIFDITSSLAQLNAKYGVFAGLGNHEHWTDVKVVTQGLEEARLPLLVNQGMPIPVGKDVLYLASLDDGWSGKPDLAGAMENWPSNAPTVLLMHEPDLAPKYAPDKRINLQLSGHSHGGQVRLPAVGPLILPYLSWKYPMGLYNIDGMWLYTNRGIGTTNVPLRVNCAPEITELTLVGV